MFGNRAGTTTSIEAEWSAGRTPLATQRAAFETRVDTDVRSGALSQSTGTRLKYDYYELVQLEARYGADRRFTTQERSELADRYGALTQALADGSYDSSGPGYGDDRGSDTGYGSGDRTESVAEGQAEFNARVNAAVTARRITRAAGTRLRADYATLVRTEAAYLRDGRLNASERDELEAQLDALDVRVGDVGYGGGSSVQTFYEREVPTAVRRMITALQPALIVVMGGVVLLVALAMILPILSIYQSVGTRK